MEETNATELVVETAPQTRPERSERPERAERGEYNRDGFKRRQRKKVCQFCKDKATYIDYKDTTLLRKFISDRGKIRARRVSGNCSQHQRDVATAVKNSREMALLPYTSTER